MKIAFIITGLSTGGAETMLYKLLERLDRSRFEPYVISITSRGEYGPRIGALGIPVLTLGMRPGLPDPFKFVRLVGHLRRIKPDVVQTWMYHADLLGGLAARLVGIRAVAWALRHSNLSPEQNKRTTLMVMKACGQLSCRLPKRILSCSERARAAHVSAGYCADKMVVIPNGFDLNRFMPDAETRASVRTELGLPGDTPLVGLIARDDPQKNHPGFVEAAARVHRTLPDVHFLLAGTGIEHGNCRLVEHISQAGLADRFHLLGRRDDIPRLMAALDLLASSSFGEAFPNVLGEAMACGVPCVVTDVGDSAEIVGNTGSVVAAGDMAGLARHLIEWLQLPQLEREAAGSLARERVRTRYEISDVVRRYENFYMQLLGNDRSCAD